MGFLQGSTKESIKLCCLKIFFRSFEYEKGYKRSSPIKNVFRTKDEQLIDFLQKIARTRRFYER